MSCNLSYHDDCIRHFGPFRILDVDTGQMMRLSAYHRLTDAFKSGDNIVADARTDRDYRVVDRFMRAIPRSASA